MYYKYHAHVSHASKQLCGIAYMLIITRVREWAGVKPTCLNLGERRIVFMMVEADAVIIYHYFNIFSFPAVSMVTKLESVDELACKNSLLR
jgi:hypothetical protein